MCASVNEVLTPPRSVVRGLDYCNTDADTIAAVRTPDVFKFNKLCIVLTKTNVCLYVIFINVYCVIETKYERLLILTFECIFMKVLVYVNLIK